MIRRFLVVFLLLAAGVVDLGFYLGWFRLSTDRAMASESPPANSLARSEPVPTSTGNVTLTWPSAGTA
jgi:hypothetical protein